MEKLTNLFILGLLFTVTSLSWGQSNEFIDRMLDAPGLKGEDAAYLILVASDNLGDDAGPDRAYTLLESLGWVPAGLNPVSPITHGQFAYILMKAFGVPGGMLYSAFPTPRYAYRELKNQLVIQGAADPDMGVSGAQAMRMIGRIFDVKGIRQ